MALTQKHYQQAQQIDSYVQQVLAKGGGDEQLLETMYDYMPLFKDILDASAKGELDQLCNRYDGFYRFANLLERLAQGIQEGRIDVP